MEKKICSECVENSALEEYIVNEEVEGRCSYCIEEGWVVESGELMEYIKISILTEYDRAVECLGYDGREGGFQGTTYDSDELVDEIRELDEIAEDFREELVDFLSDEMWCDIDPYGDDESFILRHTWEYFVELIKTKRRYFFWKTDNDEESTDYASNTHLILEDIAQNIIDLNLIASLERATVIYRGRRGNLTPSCEKLGPPPSEKAQQNRMSPAGISMFYGAFDQETIIAEILDENLFEPVTIGSFKTTQDFSVIDFTKLPQFISIFDKEDRGFREKLMFMKSFLRDFVSPIEKDGREHVDSVPTQIVTEFIRDFFLSYNVQGILYPSSKNNKKCCVLFFDCSNCTQDAQDDRSQIYLSLESADTIVALPEFKYSRLNE